MSARFSVATTIAVIIMVFGLLTWDAPLSETREIDWTGTITRIFLSGGSLEIVGDDIPGGAFQASMPNEQTSPILEGSVRVHGRLIGTTCAYGGYRGTCVPDVEIIDIQ